MQGGRPDGNRLKCGPETEGKEGLPLCRRGWDIGLQTRKGKINTTPAMHVAKEDNAVYSHEAPGSFPLDLQ